MSRKASKRSKLARRAISPLIGAFTQNLDSTRPHQGVLRSYVAIDALKRGQGSDAMFLHLAQMFVISEYLCEAGYCRDELRLCSDGKDAVMELDAKFGDQEGDWVATPAQYEAMRLAVDLLDRQVKSASPRDFAAAYLRMNAYVERS